MGLRTALTEMFGIDLVLPDFRYVAERADRLEAIVLTHGHGDHVGDTLDVAKQTGATVTTNYDLCMWLAGKGLEKFNPMNTGGTTDLGGFTVTMVRADHSSGDIVDGMPIYLGNPCGVIVKAKGEPTVWHLGDTDIFSDMALLAEIHAPKVAIVNEEFARKFNLGRNAIGKSMALDPRAKNLDVQIVGLVRNSAYANVKQKPQPLFFTPYRQDTTIGNLNFYVRAARTPEQIVREVPAVIKRLDANLPIGELKER